MIALIAAAAAADELWFVPDEALAGALREAVTAEWPEVEHEIRVGPAPEEQVAWAWDGRTLVLAADDAREGEAADPHVAALLARTWVLRADSPGFERWAPTPAVSTTTVRRPPHETASAPGWSLSASVGVRTATGEPGLGQGVRFSQSATMGVVLWTAEFYGGLAPADRIDGTGPFSSDDPVDDLRLDRATFGTSLGLRSQGHLFGQATLGIERRTIDHVLDRQGVSAPSFRSNDLAVPVRVAFGLRAGRLTPQLGGFVRVTPGLPVTVGGELDLGFEWARDRRVPVGDADANG